MEKPEESELHGILTAHAARYPRMRPADAVKLLYQQEFGGGHLVTDPADSLVRLRTERAAVKSDPSAPLFEELGGGVVRVMLEAQEEANYPLEQLNRDFIRSAELRTGDRERFRNKLRRRVVRRCRTARNTGKPIIRPTGCCCARAHCPT